MVGTNDKARGFSLSSIQSVPLQPLPPYPPNQPKVLVDSEYYYQIINNHPKALVDRVGYNLNISTNNHMNERSEGLDGVVVNKKRICSRE